jgi:hypothetical protein
MQQDALFQLELGKTVDARMSLQNAFIGHVLVLLCDAPPVAALVISCKAGQALQGERPIRRDVG